MFGAVKVGGRCVAALGNLLRNGGLLPFYRKCWGMDCTDLDGTNRDSCGIHTRESWRIVDHTLLGDGCLGCNVVDNRGGVSQLGRLVGSAEASEAVDGPDFPLVLRQLERQSHADGEGGGGLCDSPASPSPSSTSVGSVSSNSTARR